MYWTELTIFVGRPAWKKAEAETHKPRKISMITDNLSYRDDTLNTKQDWIQKQSENMQEWLYANRKTGKLIPLQK